MIPEPVTLALMGIFRKSHREVDAEIKARLTTPAKHKRTSCDHLVPLARRPTKCSPGPCG